MEIKGIQPGAKRPLMIIGIVILLVVAYFGVTKWSKRSRDVSSEIKVIGSVAIPDAPEASSNTAVAKLQTPSDKPSVNGGTRLIHQVMAWQSQNGWIYANGGKRTTKGSLFDQYHLDIEIKRQDDCAQSVADFVKFVKDYKDNPNTPGFCITFMGSGIPAYAYGISDALKDMGAEYQPVVFESSGKSFGEDQLIGPIDVKNNPQNLKGQVCIGVRMDGDLDVAIKYANDNGIKVNPNPALYDYDALNLMYPSKADFIESANKYNAGTKEKRTIVQNGKTTQRDTMVEATMVATWTPGDQIALDGKGGCSVISTKEYASMMPNITIFCKKWVNDHRTDCENIVMALAQAGDQIRNFDDAKKFSCKLNVEVYGEKDAKYWYDTYNGIERDRNTHIGGSMVFNLRDMTNLFGLGESKNDIYKAIYTTFGDLQSKYYPKDLPTYMDYSKLVDKSILLSVIANHPELMEGKALTVDYSKKTVTDIVTSKNEQVQFEFGKATLSPSSYSTLDAVYTELLSSEGGLKVKLIGHTDNVGSSDKNLQLSLARAQSVKAYLVKKGIDPDRIDVDGKGDTDPIESNSTQAGRDANRRVQIIQG